ncbi:cyanase [Mesobacterium sp. TK19101]|uniref:Cyanate hydratase n=1 Tax=Mesobacterium hydrothermale TaxID=3111907 RepID=A0ABU6HKJ9_9RHOB|nr:cyanase [Mesobacterium sp. TK19101]MEC3862434.1 cyanase [Mesobacterium sp. TK19101]
MTTRAELTEKIIAHKTFNDIKWADVAAAVGQSKEWVTAALMGQISLSKDQIEKAGNALKLNFSDEETALLMTVPYRGSLPTAVPTDPLIYRLYEVVNVYGTTMKALIEEEFGDGIMSAIDFTMDISREANPAGDRVKIVLDGKFLPYKMY